MTTFPLDDALLEVVDRVERHLLDGTYFALHAESHRTRRPGCVLRRSSYAQVLRALADLADDSDAMAQVAAAIVPRVNLYGTDAEESVHIYDAAAKAITAGYDDVVGRSGPDGGRRTVRPFSLAQCIKVARALSKATASMDTAVPGVGWAVEAVFDRMLATSVGLLDQVGG